MFTNRRLRLRSFMKSFIRIILNASDNRFYSPARDVDVPLGTVSAESHFAVFLLKVKLIIGSIALLGMLMSRLGLFLQNLS